MKTPSTIPRIPTGYEKEGDISTTQFNKVANSEEAKKGFLKNQCINAFKKPENLLSTWKKDFSAIKFRHMET